VLCTVSPTRTDVRELPGEDHILSAVEEVPIRHRSRVIPFDPIPGYVKLIHGDLEHPELGYKQTIAESLGRFGDYIYGGQVTDSEIHPEWKFRQKFPFRDIGGDFTSQRWAIEIVGPTIGTLTRQEWSFPTGSYPGGSRSDQYTYRGPILPISPYSLQWPSFSFSDSSELDRLGTIAISRCSPSNAAADFSVAITELLHEGLPHALGAVLTGWRNMSPKSRKKAIGDEYLNYEFGFKPLANDLAKGANAVIDSDATWRQYARDSGKLVRRRYEFPIEESTTGTVVDTFVSAFTNPSSSAFLDFGSLNKGRILRTETFRRRRWFSGAFTYYVPPPHSGFRNEIARQVIQARKCLGVSLTPDTLWNLAPWSWLIDWRLNIGSLLSNWTDWAIDNQVLVYGYMMEHTFREYLYAFDGPTGLIGFGNNRPSLIKLTVESKVRRQASPYGFGVDWGSLNPHQLSILAALGITRDRK